MYNRFFYVTQDGNKERDIFFNTIYNKFTYCIIYTQKGFSPVSKLHVCAISTRCLLSISMSKMESPEAESIERYAFCRIILLCISFIPLVRFERPAIVLTGNPRMSGRSPSMFNSSIFLTAPSFQRRGETTGSIINLSSATPDSRHILYRSTAMLSLSWVSNGGRPFESNR